jgi:cystathionine gamma-lyase
VKFESQCIHAGQPPEPTTGAVMTPIFLTSTYAQAGPGEHKGFEYSRTQNPTRFALEANLAALEHAEWGLAFASGLAASTTVLHLLAAGDHVVAGDDLYGGTYRLFERVFRQSGLSFTYVDPRAAKHVEAALTPRTRLCWLETPTNPLLKEADIAAIAQVCRARGVLLAVDNTFLTPFYQRPLELGADLVVHSTTKYLNGHSDVVGGAVCGRDPALRDKMAFLQNAMGGVPSPMDCFLVLRGTKTLAVRMQRHTENAQAIAAWLRERPEVERVVYPGRGGMVTVFFRLQLDAVRRLLRAVRVFACAESLGGVESLIEHPAIMTHASIPQAVREAVGITDGMIRLSVGIEHQDDLIGDLDAALAAVRKDSLGGKG